MDNLIKGKDSEYYKDIQDSIQSGIVQLNIYVGNNNKSLSLSRNYHCKIPPKFKNSVNTCFYIFLVIQ